MPIPPMVSRRSLRALSVLSPSLGFVCVGLSLMRVVYQVCSSSVEELRKKLGKQTKAAGSTLSRKQPPPRPRDRDWMPKSMCVLLACLVLAAGQAAKRDTTQWRCRNRKLSCKRWAADNQCTANYAFMAEGALHHHLRAHGTRHTQRRTARDT